VSDAVVVGRFAVAGRPRTKGSLTPQMSRGGGGKLRVHLVEKGEYSVPWKKTMIAAIRHEMNLAAPMMAIGLKPPYAGPVEVRALFLVDRTVGVNGEVWPSHRTERPTAEDIGDLDKFARNLLDALTQSKLIADDRLVTSLRTYKFWTPAELAGREGVYVTVLADDTTVIPPEFVWMLK